MHLQRSCHQSFSPWHQKKHDVTKTRGRKKKIEGKRCSWSTKLFSFAHIFSLFLSVLEVLFKENTAGRRRGDCCSFWAFFLSAVGCWSQKFTWKVLRQDYPHLQPPWPFIPAPTHTLRICEHTPSDLNARSIGQQGSTPPSKQDAIFG